jgi:hypothetical protein
MRISSGSPKFETPSAALFINSPYNSSGSFGKSSHCSFVNKYPKKQDGLNRDAFISPWDTKIKTTSETTQTFPTTTTTTTTSKIFGDNKNKGGAEQKIFSGVRSATSVAVVAPNPFFAATPASSATIEAAPFHAVSLFPSKAGASSPFHAVNPFSSKAAAPNPCNAVFSMSSKDLVVDSSAKQFSQSTWTFPASKAFTPSFPTTGINPTITAASSAATAFNPFLAVPAPMQSAVPNTANNYSASTIGGVASAAQSEIGGFASAQQPSTIFNFKPAAPAVAPNPFVGLGWPGCQPTPVRSTAAPTGGFFVSPPSSISYPVFPTPNNWISQPFPPGPASIVEPAKAWSAPAGPEVAPPKTSMISSQQEHHSRGLESSITAPTTWTSNPFIANKNNTGGVIPAGPSNITAVSGTGQQQQQQVLEFKAQPEDVSRKIEFLMKQCEEILSSSSSSLSPSPETHKTPPTASTSAVDDTTTTTFRGFSGSNKNFLPEKFTRRACTARAVPRGLRTLTDMRPSSTQLPPRTGKPLSSYTLESLSSPDLLYLGGNAKMMAMAPPSGLRQREDTNTDITAGLPPRNVITQRASTVRVHAVPAAEDPATPPTLTSEGYWTSPDMSILKAMSDSELSKVERFTICRDNYGKIEWDGFTDVRGLALDKLVRVEQKEVFVYGDGYDSSGLHHPPPPPVGTELNKGAVITLWEVFPKSCRRGGVAEDDGKRFTEKLRKFCAANDANHISYSAATGEWVFAVKHF